MSALGSVLSILDRPFDIMDTAVHTDASFFGSASRWPLTIANSVHLYHMVGGFSLSSADYFHHLMFIPTLGLSGQVFSWGAGANWQAFYISGLPGGIDYFLLGLIKVKMLEPMKEKRINANLNTWLRAPGILMTTILLFASLRAGVHLKPGQAPTSAPVWAIVMQLILPPYNALYYGKQAVANYAVHYMLHLLGEDDLIKKRIEERTSVTTGTQILAWKDALAVPQRGSQRATRASSRVHAARVARSLFICAVDRNCRRGKDRAAPPREVDLCGAWRRRAAAPVSIPLWAATRGLVFGRGELCIDARRSSPWPITATASAEMQRASSFPLGHGARRLPRRAGDAVPEEFVRPPPRPPRTTACGPSRPRRARWRLGCGAPASRPACSPTTSAAIWTRTRTSGRRS